MGAAWTLFMWGIIAGYIVETSLGFFINPIFSVVLAVVVLKEPLRKYQIVSVLLAFAGVLVVAIAYGKFP
jgi:chloramphenicol-sensitive protein RarD